MKTKLGEQMDYGSEKSLDLELRSGEILLPKINWQEPLEIEI